MSNTDPLDQRDLDGINARFDEIKETLTRIEHKQDYTNGRVMGLEKTHIYFRGFMGALAFVLGLPAIIGTIIGVTFAIKEYF